MEVAKLLADGLAVLAAVIAAWQAWKAKGYKNEILADRRRYALVDMFASAKRTREEVKKLTRPVSGRPMRGVNASEVLAVVQSCADDLDQNCHRYGIDGLDQKIEDIKQLLKSYTSTTDESLRFDMAESLYEKLSAVIKEASQKMDA